MPFINHSKLPKNNYKFSDNIYKLQVDMVFWLDCRQEMITLSKTIIYQQLH